MYCIYCGYKVEDSYNVCPNCGAILKNNDIVISNNNFISNTNIQNQIYVQKNSNWQDIISIVCSGLGLYFCYIAFISYEQILSENLEVYQETPLAAALGCVFIQVVFATIGLILALISKKKNPNKFNKVGIILSLLIYSISVAQVIMVLNWF